VVYRRHSGSSKDSAFRCLDDGHIALCDLLLHLPTGELDTEYGCHLCDDIQRGIWILVGTYPMAVPARDSAS
jgi:hypothetical protein